jgi:hypothetical protein
MGLIIGVVESRVSQLHASAVLHFRARLSASRPTQNREILTRHRNRSNRIKRDIDESLTPSPSVYCQHVEKKVRTVFAVA